MPPKKIKSAKPKARPANAATRSVAGKRKRVDDCDLSEHREDTTKKPRLEEVLCFKLLEIPNDVLYEVRVVQSNFRAILTGVALRFARICILSACYISRARARRHVRFS